MGKKERRESIGKRLGRELTKQEQQIFFLSEIASKLATYENRNFARSLVRQFTTMGHLTEKQWWWVRELRKAPYRHKRVRPTVVGKFFVYALAAADRVKIGFSDDPDDRLRSIQTGCPYPVRLLGTQQFETRNAAQAREKELHDKFGARRVHGEWFFADIRDELLLMLRGEIR